MTVPTDAAIALNRFGLGGLPDQAPPADAKRWLLDQFGRFEVRPAGFAALPDARALAQRYVQQQAVLRLAQKDAKAAAAAGTTPATDEAADAKLARQMVASEARDAYRAAVNARMASALTTPAPFIEHLTHFWANHFALSVEKPQVLVFAGDYEATAIRPHVLGKFEDMLFAVERHPAMLYYLDQFRSVGPDSNAARLVALRRPDAQLGLNENLAREIMELHTLGVRTGYTQADVTEFARALTGWSINGIGPQAGAMGGQGGDTGGFQFRPNIHEPGSRTIMGKAYAQDGEAQGRSVLHDLATSPATARHVSFKLARHFVADDPPPALVDRLTATYLKSDGSLPALYRVLIDAPEAWAPQQVKFKMPWEWSVSALRALGRRELGPMDIAPMQNQLGQPVWKPGSPAGYDDIAASWAGPDALMRRVELAQRFAANVGDRIDARSLAPKLLPGALTPATATALAQADSGPTALALLLVSPEFQRR